MEKKDDPQPEAIEAEGGGPPEPPPPAESPAFPQLLAQLRELQEWAYRSKAHEAHEGVVEVREPAGEAPEPAPQGHDLDGEPGSDRRVSAGEEQGPRSEAPDRQVNAGEEQALRAEAPDRVPAVEAQASGAEASDRKVPAGEAQASGVEAPDYQVPAGEAPEPSAEALDRQVPEVPAAEAQEPSAESLWLAARLRELAQGSAGDSPAAAAKQAREPAAQAREQEAAAVVEAPAAISPAATAPSQPAPGPTPETSWDDTVVRIPHEAAPAAQASPVNQPARPSATEGRGRPAIKRRQGSLPARGAWPAATGNEPAAPAASPSQPGRPVQAEQSISPAPRPQPPRPQPAQPQPARPPRQPRTGRPATPARPARSALPPHQVPSLPPLRLDRRAAAAAVAVLIALVLLGVFLLRAHSQGHRSSALPPGGAPAVAADRSAGSASGEGLATSPPDHGPTTPEKLAAAGGSPGAIPSREAPAPPARLAPIDPGPAPVQPVPMSSQPSQPSSNMPENRQLKAMPKADAPKADAGANAETAPDSDMGGSGIPEAPSAPGEHTVPAAPGLGGAPAAGAVPGADAGTGALPMPRQPGAFPAPQAPESPAPRAPESRAPQEASRPRGAEDLNGSWEIRNVVSTTNHPAYRGLWITYRIVLHQDGDQLSGDGEKWAENGRRIPAAQRTPIHVSGEIVGREVRVQFTERGNWRVSGGSFRWRLSPDGGSFSGTFASSAADSRGTSAAVRLP